MDETIAFHHIYIRRKPETTIQVQNWKWKTWINKKNSRVISFSDLRLSHIKTWLQTKTSVSFIETDVLILGCFLHPGTADKEADQS